MTTAQENRPRFITIRDAAKQLGVSRQTIYQYKRIFNVKLYKFELDRNMYMTLGDVARIKDARDAAAAHQHDREE